MTPHAANPASNAKALEAFLESQAARGVDMDAVRRELRGLAVETPSWGYGDSGTRFRVFKKAGVPRTPFEKIDDAAEVHRLTGLSPSVAVHIPWDKTDDYGALAAHAEAAGVRIGAVNPNLFQADEYMLGSVTSENPATRARAMDHLLECVDAMRALGSDTLSLWYADGTNYPGQADIRKRKRRMEEAHARLHGALQEGERMLIEYKFFEPAFYHTDLADWGMALSLATKSGPKAEVLVDTGHHAPGTNVEHIVAFLLDEGRLGGFHFNARKYADDDLIVGSQNPYELFLIFHQILQAKRDGGAVAARAGRIAYMIDQSHNIEPKIPAMMRSVLNVEFQYAKALLINWDGLAAAQAEGDVMAAEACVREAFEQDPTPLLRAMRVEAGRPEDPMAAFKDSGYAERVAAERGTGGASW